MMAFENTGKRPGQDLVTNNLEQPKKRKVEFSEDVTLHPASQDINGNDGFSMEMYRRFTKSALDDMEKVCFAYFAWFFLHFQESFFLD